MWDIGCARATCCAREVIYFLCTLNGITQRGCCHASAHLGSSVALARIYPLDAHVTDTLLAESGVVSTFVRIKTGIRN
jgi:hypothetical protein